MRRSDETATAFDPDLVRGIADGLKGLDGALLPILHAVNDHFGYFDERAIPIVADVLNLSRAEVHGVVTFYHDFRHEPAGPLVVRICRAEACQSMGVARLIEDACSRLGVVLGGTSADGVTVEPVYCLGNCALAPAVQIGGRLHGRVDARRFDALLAEALA